MEDNEDPAREMVDQFDGYAQEPLGAYNTNENFSIGVNENVSDDKIQRECSQLKESAYEDDIQHIDNLLRKYQMHTNPIDDDPYREDEAPYEPQSELFEEPPLSSPFDYENFTEMQSSSSEEPAEQLEIIVNDATCSDTVVTNHISNSEVTKTLELETSITEEILEADDRVGKKAFQ